jgi:GR25 family glycosyltransferase involved in LPS biosynthesis
MPYQVNTETDVFYINLDDNRERRENIEGALMRLHFRKFMRVPAVDTRTIAKLNKYRDLIDKSAYETLMEGIKIGARRANMDLTKGAVGCYLSHLSIYNMMVNNSIPHAIVFEDDCNITDTYRDFWDKMGTIRVPQSADIFLFDAIVHEYNLLNCPSAHACEVYFFWGTHFYLITLSGAKKIFEFLLPIMYQFDSALSILSYSRKLRIFSSYNIKLCEENKFGSTIQLINCPTCNTQKEISNIKGKINRGNGSDLDIEKFQQFKQIEQYCENSGYGARLATCMLILLVLLVILLNWTKH